MIDFHGNNNHARDGHQQWKHVAKIMIYRYVTWEFVNLGAELCFCRRHDNHQLCHRHSCLEVKAHL